MTFYSQTAPFAIFMLSFFQNMVLEKSTKVQGVWNIINGNVLKLKVSAYMCLLMISSLIY